MPGPKPTPTITLANRGSWRAKTRDAEPQPEQADNYAPPRGFPKDARRIWRELAPHLVAAGLLTSADVPSFARYCRLYAIWQRVMKDAEDKPTRANILAVAKVEELIRKLDAGFGLTPADRTGISVDPPATGNGKGRFFETRNAS